MVIYKIVNKINQKQYIGQTTRSFKERISEHCRKDNTLIGKAIKKYGIDNFECVIIDKADDTSELNKKEMYWIRKLNTMTPNGYNLCYGGNNTKGYSHREESKEKMSLTKLKLGTMKGPKNHFYGKNHTEETKEKLKKSWTNDRKQRMSEFSKKLDRSYSFVKVRNITTGRVYDSIKEASQDTGVLETHITRVCKGKRKSAGGYKWEYA